MKTMIELKGKYASAKVFTDVVDQNAIAQVISLLNQPYAEGSNVRMMPDIHAGAGCTIGTTMTIKDKVCPNLVGVDIGCGVIVVTLGNIDIDFGMLDNVIREYVPAGKNVHAYADDSFSLKKLNCFNNLHNTAWLECSLGTLGGGNHFIEIDQDNAGCKYLVIHTGSRNLGKQVAEVYQDIAIKRLNDSRNERQEIIRKLKAEGREREIQETLAAFKSISPIPNDLCYLEGEDMKAYLEDMDKCQTFAAMNRNKIAKTICGHMGWSPISSFQTIHNYIDIKNMVLRKGAVSAQNGERLIIPINMRDGSLICVGRGNPDWNCSAPHGAGRLMSRGEAKKMLTVPDFEQQMAGIFTTTVGQDTIDEAPMAYKHMEDIVDNIADTVSIENVIKPIYNFKASD